ncbi:group II intron reverse transcriptase/maturase (plasmid) [Priestia megaterium]|uniref:Group II intron reverse transcriptase/maturase n=2 Tax=Priestia megaterium TaxID=1404 RepID=A0A6M6E1Z0_PRIMG|nr:group II intron reverse transcriptase/maturase [Priestia megaterium]
MNDEETPWQLKGFKSLLEVIESKPVIVQALEKLKRNDGSMTAGVDKKTIRDFLELPFDKLVEYVRKSLCNYTPDQVKRVWIDKPGKKEKRPLGIPTIGDRIIQECVRIVIEPILEAQFWDHSYGFRPYRDQHHAYARTVDVIYKTGYFWVVEGDISKFFDKVNHTILLKKLYAMGIRDKRVLMLIKQMLKAGVMSETSRNELGTPQGGIISPLLANVYLHSLDKWIAREWEEKKFQLEYSTTQDARMSLKRTTKVKPAYFIRYADDWVLVTNTKENAEKWKWRISQFLKNRLKLELSEEKTLITNVTQKSVKLLGFEIKFVKRYNTKKLRAKGQKNGLHGYVSQTKPDKDRLRLKIKLLREQIKKIREKKSKTEAIHQINIVNSTIIGLHNYYNVTTQVNPVFSQYSKQIWFTARRSTKRLKSILIDANKTDNLTKKHEDYRTEVVAIKDKGQTIGITSLAFVKTKIKDNNSMIKSLKNQNETPFSPLGRKHYYERSGKRPMADREDEILSLDLSFAITKGKMPPMYNTEFMCNRGRAFNIAKGKCQGCKRVVGRVLKFHTHHKEPNLPLDQVNKTNKLAIVCIRCHNLIHNNKDYSNPEIRSWLDQGGFKRITKLRDLLKKQPNPNRKRKTKAKTA